MVTELQQQLGLTRLDQVGFVVRDLEASIALYEPMFGPFTLMEPGPMEYDYRGQQEVCELRLAFGHSGSVEIELIQWCHGGCPHKEFIDAGREGMHHLRFDVAHMETAVERAAVLNYQPIWRKRFGEGSAVAYLERSGDPLVIELYENHTA